MKKCLSIGIYFLFTVLCFGQAIPIDSLYLGQTPPGNTPKIFNLSATSGLRPIERIAITSDGKEIYYGELNTYPPSNQRIKYYKYLDNKWQGPFILFEDYNSPRLSVNDSILYIQKHQSNKSYTYYSERTETGWTTPKIFYSQNQQTHYLQNTELNNYYVSTNLPGSSSQRDVCRLIITNTDTVFQSLGSLINTSNDENDLFVAEDESYLIFSRQVGTTDMYISFKNSLDDWTAPIKFAVPINTPSPNWEYGQFVTQDKKYLFFTRGGNSMGSYYTYWVRIDNIIDSLKNTVVGIEYSEEVLPTNFNLYQNYPNPFNPSTKISFSLAVDSKVSLKIFNVLGQEVATLVNRQMSAGNQKVTFDASSFNSGVYFYRIDASGIDGQKFSSVKKMILTK